MSSKSLPERPSLEHLKTQAKDLLAAYRAGDPDAAVRVHPYFDPAAPIPLSAAQLVLAREYGFESWAKLKAHVAARAGRFGDLTERADRFVESAAGITPALVSTLMERLKEEPDLGGATLAVACTTGDTDAARRFLDAEPTLLHAKIAPKGWEPLLYTCYSGLLRDAAVFRPRLIATARLLLDRGADPNASWQNEDHWREAALYGATGVNDCPELTEMLLRAGADPNDGESMYHAAELPEPACLKLLLEHGGNIQGMNVFARVLDFERPEWVRLMLSHAPSPAAIPPILPHALRRGRSTETFRVLIESGMDLNTPGDAGLTPFQAATRLGRSDVTELMATAGADTTLSAADALIGRLARGERVTAAEITPEIVRALDTEAPTPTVTVLAERGNDAVLDALLTAGANPNVADSNGFTPLHHAALGGRLPTVRLLLRHGADPKIRDNVHKGDAVGFACAGSEHIRAAAPEVYVQMVMELLDAGAALPERAWGSTEVRAALVRRGAKAV